jgi:hypothetical protein
MGEEQEDTSRQACFKIIFSLFNNFATCKSESDERDDIGWHIIHAEFHDSL